MCALSIKMPILKSLETYLMILVDEECLKLVAINTHKGLFKLKRLPFRLKVAPSLFQQLMDTMLAGLEFAYLDDILLRSENNEQHTKHIKVVFQKIDEYGFKLSSEKCEFFMKQIKYLGQIIDENRRRPDLEGLKYACTKQHH